MVRAGLTRYNPTHAHYTRKTLYNWREKGLIETKTQGRGVLLSAESIETQLSQKLPITTNCVRSFTQKGNKFNYR